MPCEWRRLADGTVVHIRTSASKAQACCACARRATLLCDGPPPPGAKRKTCDAPLCPEHAVHVGPDRDLCPACADPRRS
jgi:hypothetical protein